MAELKIGRWGDKIFIASKKTCYSYNLSQPLIASQMWLSKYM
jgi:hypothetical protein